MRLSAADIQVLELRAEYYASYTLATKLYREIRWLIHCSKVYNLPPRQLRKCHMRKYYRRRRQARERYL